MQAVRLARYHTGRSHLVRSAAPTTDGGTACSRASATRGACATSTRCSEMDASTLRVLDSRRDIACVLVNPLQALHPNTRARRETPRSFGGERAGGFDRTVYTAWLARLRGVCTRRGIVLIVDEVFVGFRLAYGGAQEYFGIHAES